jgi:uncharacterized protein
LNKISVAARIDAAANAINMTEDARYFPLEAYTSMPWRNGAGVTREIAREPPQGESFAWRLSLASLQASGPFSSYAGHQRCVALVDGRGFRLHVAGAKTKTLAARGDHALFAGAAAVSCELLDGPCTDLSLIVHDPGTIASVTRLVVSAEHRVEVPSGRLRVLFTLHGSIKCHAFQASKLHASSGYPFRLNGQDTLLIHGRGYAWLITPASHDVAELLVIDFAAA